MSREDARQAREVTELCNEKVTESEAQRRMNVLSRLDEEGEMSTKVWVKRLKDMRDEPEAPKTRRGQEHSNRSSPQLPKPRHVSSLPNIKEEPDLERPAKKVKAKGSVARVLRDNRTPTPDTDRWPFHEKTERDQAFYDCWKAADKQMKDRSRGQEAAKLLEQKRAQQSLDKESARLGSPGRYEEEESSQDEQYSPNEFDDSSIERYDQRRKAQAEEKEARLQRKFRESSVEKEARIKEEQEEYDELMRQQMIWKDRNDNRKPENREPYTASPRGQKGLRKGQAPHPKDERILEVWGDTWKHQGKPKGKGKGKGKPKGKGKGKGKGKKDSGKRKDRGLVQAVQQSLLDQCEPNSNAASSSGDKNNEPAAVDTLEVSAADKVSTKVRLTFDTGAAVVALPENFATDHRISGKPEGSYKTASAEIVQDRGARVIKGEDS